MARNARPGRLAKELLNKLLHAAADLVADWPDDVDSLAARVVESPIFVALTRVARAGVAATHRDHNIGRLYRFGGKDLGSFRRTRSSRLNLATTASNISNPSRPTDAVNRNSSESEAASVALWQPTDNERIRRKHRRTRFGVEARMSCE
jgi:hypothetical protein